MRVFQLRPPERLGEAERARHPSWRRWTRRYTAKQRIVRQIWIVSGLLMLALPLGGQLALALPTTFLAFAVLDETE